MHTRIRGGVTFRVIRTAIALAAPLAACHREPNAVFSVPGGDPERGKQQIVAYGCGSCHIVPSVPQAQGLVGPPLTHFAGRGYIAGEVPNNPQFLTQWISVPQSIEPGTAMPNLGVSEAKARDIAAYLYTLK
jgi:cytochrome c